MNYHQQPHLIFVSPDSKPGTSNYSTVQTIPIVLSTSTSSSYCNNNQQVDGNAKIKMIQQTTNVQHPRLHPKKRKFDLAELEDDVQSSSNACNNQQQDSQQQIKTFTDNRAVVGNVQNLNGNGNGNGTHVEASSTNENHNSTAIATNQHQYNLKVSRETEHFTKKPFSTSSYSPSCLPAAPSSHQQVPSSTIPVDQADLVDLKEWTNHNVLAKRKDIYYPGVIAGTTAPCNVVVAFRHPEGQQQIFQDIFSSGLFDVISDRVPSMKEVIYSHFIKFPQSK